MSFPPTFQQGIDEFNRQEFYACHDTLEALWMDSTEPHKTFYQGILQIAVGCYHLGNFNWHGAVTLLGEGTRRIRDYQPSYENIDVERLFDDSLALLYTLQQTEPDRVAELVAQIESNEIEESGYCLPQIHRGRGEVNPPVE
jgi:predicted metal-dependent hydrolase